MKSRGEHNCFPLISTSHQQRWSSLGLTSLLWKGSKAAEGRWVRGMGVKQSDGEELACRQQERLKQRWREIPTHPRTWSSVSRLSWADS